MKEFIKRLKSLKKELVFQILIERIQNFETMLDQNSIKTLTVQINFIDFYMFYSNFVFCKIIFLKENFFFFIIF